MEPNSSTDDILDVSLLNFDGDFETQVNNILQRVRLTRPEVESLELLINDLETALETFWRGCEVQPFGSIITGLGIKTSDVDCYIQLPENVVPKRNIVILARNILRKLPWIFGDLFAIPTAKVPILKFLHKPTNCHCDVNFQSPSGVRNSKLVAYLLNTDFRALSLAILVKYWSKVHCFTGTNLMTNYSFVIMVIFYLQVRNILPSIYELQKDVPVEMVDGWNTAFNKDFNHYKMNANYDSLYEILGKFFKFYAIFDYDSEVIAPYTGSPLKKHLFTNIKNVPDNYALYRYNVLNKVSTEMRVDSKICIQDPFEHYRNNTVAVFPKLYQKIIGHFKFAAKMYEERRGEDFLRAVFTEDPQISVRQATPAVPKHTPKHHNAPNKVIKEKYNHTKQKLKRNFNRWFMENRKIAKEKR